MQINLVFEDRFTLEQDIQWEFRNFTRVIDFNEIRHLILNSFNQAAEFFKLNDMAPFSESEIEIMVLQRSPESKNILAYFDLSRTKEDSNEFCFRLYADVLYGIIRDNNAGLLKNIWIHEIMHLIDYKELLENLKLFRKCDTIGNPAYYYAERGERKDKHIIFLRIIMRFRNEGIATLLEFISGGKADLISPDEISGLFTEVFEAAISFSNHPDMLVVQLNTFFEETVDPLSYKIGAGIVLGGLIRKYPGNKAFKEIQKNMKNCEPCSGVISEEQLFRIRNFNSLDFIHYCLDPDSVYRNIYNLSIDYAENLNIYNGFYSTLKRINSLKDSKGFVWMMQKIMGSTMAMEEIKECHSRQMTAGAMPIELINKAERLYRCLQKDANNEVARWSLTYLYDQVDLLNDTLDYFGYLDDLEVVNTAIRITLHNKPAGKGTSTS